jgi:hypothetical protein
MYPNLKHWLSQLRPQSFVATKETTKTKITDNELCTIDKISYNLPCKLIMQNIYNIQNTFMTRISNNLTSVIGFHLTFRAFQSDQHKKTSFISTKAIVP